jgi:L-alanine-DL-glutamate epimerase-like enolase superfamily enzyme
LRETFVRNALVSVDNALWQLYGRLNQTEDFISLVPENYRRALGYKHSRLCNVPLITYGTKTEDIKKLLDNGACLLKIKIGSDPEGDGSLDKMLQWDKARLNEIFDIASVYRSDNTVSGKILYYLDANGRYDSLERVAELLEYLKAGMLESIVLFEEPFSEDKLINVSNLHVRVAADESVHSVKDVKVRRDLGYKAVALKAVAKTMSETLKILEAATDYGMHCFCADLTVNPLLVEFNKNIAARIALIPELKIGILESNGEQNYTHWQQMCRYHPMFDSAFALAMSGEFCIDEEFYKTSGGIFRESEYYDNLVK